MGVVPEVKIEVQRLGRKEDMVFVVYGLLRRLWWGLSLPPFLGSWKVVDFMREKELGE